MFRFGVRSLRKLKDSGLIDIKRITILVGKNSSGKSTFLRTLPLLRQSVSTRIRSPILWWTEDVDFGSFEGAVSQNDQRSSIGFSIGLDTIRVRPGYSVYRKNFTRSDAALIGSTAITLDVSSAKGPVNTSSSYISRVEAHFDETGSTVNIFLAENSVMASMTIDGNDVTNLFDRFETRIYPGSILPLFVNVPKEKDDDFSGASPLATELLLDTIETLLQTRSRLNQSQEATRKLVLNVAKVWPLTREGLAVAFEKAGLQAWTKLAQELRAGEQTNFFDDLKRVCLASKIFAILRSAADTLRELSMQVSYIGPARARSERYYRFQDLAVSQIDANGKNFPMFLNSLTPAQLKGLSRWIEGLFDFGLDLNRTAGHMAIELTLNGKKRNIVDTGYGVSQILPVLGQIWWASNSPRKVGPGSEIFLVAIEQPELHLHPAHQALLADSLIQISDTDGQGAGRKRQINYVIETHSEVFVNRVGELISRGRIKAEDVQVLLFQDGAEDSSYSEINISDFRGDGVLRNWPYGFFQPDVR